MSVHLNKRPPLNLLPESEINYLMKQALGKMPYVPFAFIVDKLRYRIFRGEIPPEKYNVEWWKMR